MSIANTEMAAAWDDEAPGWIEFEESYTRASVDLWQLFLTGLDLSQSDDVLDLGCGTGARTCTLTPLVSRGSVVGLDLSPAMIAHARESAARAGIANVEFVAGDAQVYPFGADSFDVVISSFGSMFFADPVAAFTNLRGALRREGRLALLTWRGLAENEWMTALRNALAIGRELPTPPTGAPGPYGLADPDHVRRVLGDAGFSRIELDPLDADIDLGADVDSAYRYVRAMGLTRGMTAELDDADRSRALAAVRDTLLAHETPNGVRIPGAAWRITAARD